MSTAYATLAELKTRLGDELYAQLSDLSGGTTPSDTVGQARLDDAHGYVNARLSARYLTPIDTTGNSTLAEMLRAFVCAVVAHDLLAMHGDAMNNLRPGVDTRLRYWIDLLRDIQSGKAALPGAAPLPSPTSGGPTSEAFGDERVFTSDSMKGF
ncbi:MAG: DUF1320 family protein [Phycisphaerae bacterium]|nr:DUF1320 family protein [Phycisphaerae bacterium]